MARRKWQWEEDEGVQGAVNKNERLASKNLEVQNVKVSGEAGLGTLELQFRCHSDNKTSITVLHEPCRHVQGQ